jgi:formyltetrahydrofolate synthetase
VDLTRNDIDLCDRLSNFHVVYDDADPLWEKIEKTFKKKTQYSFSTDAHLRGAPSGHTINVREVRLSAGAEFVVMICGDIMTMPGLPKAPAAQKIDIGDDGKVVGLF